MAQHYTPGAVAGYRAVSISEFADEIRALRVPSINRAIAGPSQRYRNRFERRERMGYSYGDDVDGKITRLGFDT